MLALACLWLCGFSRRAVQELLDENLMAAEEPTRLWPEEPKSPYGWTPFQTPPLQASTQAHAWHAGSNNPMGGHDCKHWLTDTGSLWRCRAVTRSSRHGLTKCDATFTRQLCFMTKNYCVGCHGQAWQRSEV